MSLVSLAAALFLWRQCTVSLCNTEDALARLAQCPLAIEALGNPVVYEGGNHSCRSGTRGGEATFIATGSKRSAEYHTVFTPDSFFGYLTIDNRYLEIEPCRYMSRKP